MEDLVTAGAMVLLGMAFGKIVKIFYTRRAIQALALLHQERLRYRK